MTAGNFQFHSNNPVGGDNRTIKPSRCSFWSFSLFNCLVYSAFFSHTVKTVQMVLTITQQAAPT